MQPGASLFAFPRPTLCSPQHLARIWIPFTGIGVRRSHAIHARVVRNSDIWREWTHQHPIIELRLLKNRNFASATLSNFTLGVVLNGSTILIPQFLQLQLGYSAERAGLALSPAGIALALLMPVAGILAMKFDPRKVIALGFLLTSVRMFWMMRISAEVDFAHVVWMRVFQVVGLPLIFIPRKTTTRSPASAILQEIWAAGLAYRFSLPISLVIGR